MYDQCRRVSVVHEKEDFDLMRGYLMLIYQSRWYCRH